MKRKKEELRAHDPDRGLSPSARPTFWGRPPSAVGARLSCRVFDSTPGLHGCPQQPTPSLSSDRLRVPWAPVRSPDLQTQRHSADVTRARSSNHVRDTHSANAGETPATRWALEFGRTEAEMRKKGHRFLRRQTAAYTPHAALSVHWDTDGAASPRGSGTGRPATEWRTRRCARRARPRAEGLATSTVPVDTTLLRCGERGAAGCLSARGCGMSVGWCPPRG